MSRFFSEKFSRLVPYAPGEQPRDTKYIKLNTNESSFPPTERACRYAAEAACSLNLYPDPDMRELTRRLALLLGVEENEVLLTNGSDEILDFAFSAFCDGEHPAVFPDITYGFYEVFAERNLVPYEKLPLDESFEIRVEDYIGIGKSIFIANPNAPTGILLSVSDIERIVSSNPDNIVVIDEAYIDFGGESCVPLIKRYGNLIVTGTFSKSRSMAGARLGFGVARAELVSDMSTLKYSTNPYNINRMTAAAGLGTLEDEQIIRERCREIIDCREYTARELTRLDFTLTDSRANFVFARHATLDGKYIYGELRRRGILVRRFDAPRIENYLRITVGSREEMTALVAAMKEITEAAK